jgi:demethylmenaquinone methyltransferase/2-methoxy-6-polyprenyl-1,4-benzoquinol methylase/phosphoethanolamine N-methyltransferase
MHDNHAHAALNTTGHTIHWARLYNLLFARKTTAEHKQAIRAVGLLPGERLIDVGCGPGTAALVLAKKAGPEGHVVGIDASTEMIDVARKKARKAGSTAQFEIAPIESMPYAESSFDAAISMLMLHHLPAELQDKGLAEVRRVLKPGGRLVILDFSSDSGSFFGHLLSILGHAHGGSAFPELEQKLHTAGFAQVDRLPLKRKSVMLIKAS